MLRAPVPVRYAPTFRTAHHGLSFTAGVVSLALACSQGPAEGKQTAGTASPDTEGATTRTTGEQGSDGEGSTGRTASSGDPSGTGAATGLTGASSAGPGGSTGVSTSTSGDPGGSTSGGDTGEPGHLPGLIALYTFDGMGSTVLDSSGVGEPQDLTIASEGVERVMSGLRIEPSPTIPADLKMDTPPIIDIRTPGPATKIIDAVKRSNAVSVEIWAHPTFKEEGHACQGAMRLLALGEQNGQRNLTVLHGSRGSGNGCSHGSGEWFEIRVPHHPENEQDGGQKDRNGCPAMSIPESPTVTGELQHIVYTHGADRARVLYLDGQVSSTDTHDVDLADVWVDADRLAFGNEPTPDGCRKWWGTLYTVAFYDRALRADEVAGLFEAGIDGR